jgi:hypothetical protein
MDWPTVIFKLGCLAFIAVIFLGSIFCLMLYRMERDFEVQRKEIKDRVRAWPFSPRKDKDA